MSEESQRRRAPLQGNGGGVQERVLAYMRSIPGQPVTGHAVGESSGLDSTRCYEVLARLAKQHRLGIQKVSPRTYQYLPSLDPDRAPAKRASNGQHPPAPCQETPVAHVPAGQPGDIYECLGRTSGGVVLVRGTDGVVWRLADPVT